MEPAFPDYLRGAFADVGIFLIDELLSKFVMRLEMIRRVILNIPLYS
jgi:hypothetical protein